MSLKKTYEKLGQAIQAKKKIKARGHKVQAYQCDCCGKYHVGHRSKKKS